MVALSPSFTFLATLCTLTAISMAPISEAAVLQLRAPYQEVTSTFDHTRPRAATSHDHYASSTDSRAGVQEEDRIYAPLLSIPKPTDVPPKNKTDSTDGSGSLSSKSDRKSPSGGDLHGEEDDPESDEDKHTSHGDEGSVSKKEKAKDIGRRWYLQRPMKQLKDLLGDKILGDNHVHYVRAPHHDHHHHHHHHHHGRRYSRMNWGREHKHVVSGDNEHIVYSRAPHHHHNSHEKVIVSGNHDHVRVERSPHHDHDRHHHHDGHEKVIVSGDNDHVHVRRSVFITGEQGQSYIVPHVAKRTAAQESFSLPSLGKRNGDMDGAPGRIDIMSPVADSADGKRIASLVLAPSNSTSASYNPTTYSSEFVLNASETDSTLMYLLPVSDSSTTQSTSTLTSDEMRVTIRLAMFNRASASISPFCATFDPNPPAPGPLTAEECADDPVGEHRSQLFAFDQATGVVRPMWFDGQSDGTEPEKGDCSNDAPLTPQDASLVGATEAGANNVTSSPSTAPTTIGNSTVLSADTPQAAPSNSSGSGISGVQTVALVFVAADPEILDAPAVLASTTTSSVLATSTGVGASDNAISTADGSSTTMVASSSSGSLAATSPIVLASASGSSSVSDLDASSTASNAAISAPVSTSMSGSIPSSTAAASGSDSTLRTVLGVQVVPTAEGNTPTTSTSTDCRS
ncbi:hypothetical protein EDB83DRAFT_1866086 [Lactarius deliciosus]|nr:hypothetical protein EDB83DRAFT_1866086 [Lactarius deliciosus]